MKTVTDQIIIAGSGPMAMAYAKVLQAMHKKFIVIGRSPASATKFEKETGIPAISGGLKHWLGAQTTVPGHAIVAVTENELGNCARQLIRVGVKSILVEKPGGFTVKDIKLVDKQAKEKKANVYVGYNRRFYTSTLKAIEIIKQDGGVKSFIFDFTERSNIVASLDRPLDIKANWFLQNSTHVIDMAFFMGGWPKKIYTIKKGGLKWHPNGSIYAGAGISDKKALFSYHANWESAGRWSVEIMTSKNKLIFRPLEKLQIQKYGSMVTEDVPLDDKLDIEFKPGLYKQVEAFFKNPKKLFTIGEQTKKLKYYSKINGNSKKN